MTKAEFLAILAARGLRLIQTEQVPDPPKESANVNHYMAHMMEQKGEIVQGRNIGFYVFDEGTAQEAAFPRDLLVTKNQARDAMQTYLDGLVPGTYIRTEIQSVNEDQTYGTAKALKDNADSTVSEVRLLIWKDAGQPIKHREFV